MELLFASYSTKDRPAFYLQTVKGIRWEIIPNELYTVKISLAAEYSFWGKKIINMQRSNEFLLNNKLELQMLRAVAY